MPTVPEAKISTVKESSLVSGKFTPVPNVSAGLVRGLENFAQVVSGIEQDQAALLNEARTKELDIQFNSELRDLLTDPEKGFYAQRGRLPFENQSDWEQRVRELRDRYVSLAGNENQRRMLTEVIDRRVAAAGDRMGRHVFQEFQRYQSDTSEARIEDSIIDATVGFTDPDLIRQSRATGLAELRDQAEREGWNPQVLENSQRDYISQLHTSIINRIAQDDMGLAQGYFNENRGEIHSETAGKIERALQVVNTQAIEKAASELELSVFEGKATESQVDTAFDSGIITGPKRTQLIKDLRKKEQDQAQAINRAQLISSGDSLDFRSTEHIKAVDEAFARSGRKDTDAVALILQTGIVPSDVRARLRTVARSGQTNEVVRAAQLYGVISEVNPSALSDMPTKDTAILANIFRMVRAGGSKEQAVELARKAADRPEHEAEAISTAYRQAIKGSSNESILQDLMDSDDAYDTEIFSGAPQAPTTMQADFDAMARDYYGYTGDIDLAQKMAWQSIKRVWTRTDINGSGELMRYSPEADLNVSTEKLQKDLHGQLEQIGRDPQSVRVVSDPITARSQRGQRSYALMRIREDGLPEIIRGPNNLPLRWVPDPWSVIQADHQEALEEARIKRQRVTGQSRAARRRSQEGAR